MSLEAPRIVDSKPMRFAGYEKRYLCNEPNDIPALWGRFAPNIGSIPGQMGSASYGVCFDMSETSFRYLAGVEVGGTETAKGFEVVDVPASRYAVFTFRGHVKDLPAFCSQVWCEGIPQSGQKATESGMMLERYDERFDPQTASGDVEIWIPIQS